MSGPVAVAGLTVILSIAALLAGCGPDRPPTVRVSGTITFDGPPPPAEGMVYFAAEEAAAGLPRRGGRGPFGEDGRFSGGGHCGRRVQSLATRIVEIDRGKLTSWPGPCGKACSRLSSFLKWYWSWYCSWAP